MAVYTHLCARCGHPVTGHRLVVGADSIAGPYRCYFSECECRVMQSDPAHPIRKADFDRQFPRWPRQLRPIPKARVRVKTTAGGANRATEPRQT
jgi:hypothetical protein